MGRLMLRKTLIGFTSILALGLLGSSPSYAGNSPGSMTCEELNSPHDPNPVRSWLRGFVSASGYSGEYQNAARRVGSICQEHPDWTLGGAAEYWKQELSGGSASGYVASSGPSFDCNKASLPDEFVICQSPQLAELDNTMAAGYKFLKATKGKAFAEELGRPFLKLRMACQGDAECILQRQIEAIQAYSMAGAPVSLPQWATYEDDQQSEVASSNQENTQATQQLSAAVQQNTQVQSEVAQATQATNQSIQENTAATQQVASAVTSATQLSAEKADEMNKKIADLSAQIATLSKVLEEQKKQQASTTDAEEKPAIDQTIVAINLRIETLQKQYNEVDTVFSQYLTSITPNDRDLYLTARKASQLYPKVPYYIPGTSEIGEFWVEPKVTDAGELMFNFRLIDPAAENDTTRSLINMNLAQLEVTQSALFKLYKNSVIAHDKKIRENYTKRVACFPTDQCPEERQKGEKGKTSTEVLFMIYEDGSTGGKLQQNKGAFQEGVNFSIDSALLLQAYLAHVINEAKLEFESGTRTQQQLDEMFQ